MNWIRSHDELNFDTASIWFCIGTRGSGKSSLIESIGESYLDHGHGVLDLFGSRDGEALGWLRSPWIKNKQILLLKGENVDVQCSYPVKLADSLTLEDFEKFDIIISASPLYLNIDQEFADAAKIEDTLYRRLHYKRLVYLCCREASNFYYSRLKVSDNQTFAKAQMIYLVRESRHMGVSLGLDTIRSFAIDIDIRDLSDYLLLKAQGVRGLSKDLKWLYRFVKPSMLRGLAANRFINVTKKGAIGYGTFNEVPWHKQEKEDIMKAVGITVGYGVPTLESQNRGTYKTVSDKEHLGIIEAYDKDGIGMVSLGKKFKRSPHTINLHIDGHNNSIARIGFCGSCKRMQSEYASKQVGTNAIP
jgi:hypothetical protein